MWIKQSHIWNIVGTHKLWFLCLLWPTFLPTYKLRVVPPDGHCTSPISRDPLPCPPVRHLVLGLSVCRCNYLSGTPHPPPPQLFPTLPPHHTVWETKSCLMTAQPTSKLERNQVCSTRICPSLTCLISSFFCGGVHLRCCEGRSVRALPLVPRCDP